MRKKPSCLPARPPLVREIKRVITPLGVGSSALLGMDGALITEADWQQAVPASDEAHRPRAAGAALSAVG